MQEFDIWEKWNSYLLHRSEQLNHSITQLYVDSNAKLYQLFQEEMNRAIYEWNALQFQKMAAEWSGWWLGERKSDSIPLFPFNPVARAFSI